MAYSVRQFAEERLDTKLIVIRAPEFQDLRCMSFTARGPHEILVAGCQDTMFRIDVEKGAILETLPAADNYTIMKRGGQYVCAATSTGSIHLLDLNSFSVVKEWKAHIGWINDMDAKSDFLVTCGYSPRQQLGYMLDPLANVFDLKTLMPLPPIPFQPGAAFVRMHPKMSTTSIVASQSGQIQVVDLMNPNTVNLRQANIYDTYLTSLEMAPTGEALALTDAACSIQLWGSVAKFQFTEFPNPTEFATPLPPLPPMDWSTDTPLSTVGMPYYREVLLSAWPSHMIFEVGAPPSKPDPTLMSSLKRAEIGYYGPNPRKTRRYQAENTRATMFAQDLMTAPKFLSEKAREVQVKDEPERRMSDILESMNDMTLSGGIKRDVPVMYGNVEIKYSKFGVDDFDFEYYNKTKFSGLETHIANSYANPLLQLYRFIPRVRNNALRHTATLCLYDFCMLCEMGFLFDMMEKASGQNCQATNLLKTFSSLSHASSLGLLEEHSPNRSLTEMIQSTNRYLLDKISADSRQMSPQASLMDQALTTQALAAIRCAHCANEMMRPGGSYVHELVYPAKNLKNHMRMPRPSFSQILKASVERQDQTRGWCDRCKRYQQLSTRKSIQDVPDVLMINAAVHSAEAKQLWATPNWLPQRIGIIVNHGQFYCYEGQDLQLHLTRGAYVIKVYELVGLVADINSGENQKSHLVSMIDVAHSSRNETDEDHWHLFNDFLVRQVSKEEALRFDPSWKLPCVLAYQAKSRSHEMDDSWKESLDTSLLYRRWSANLDPQSNAFRHLSHTDEAPRPEMPIAIDAEFVKLQREEIEIKADGSRETILPSRLGLARVSVLRGAGPDEGLPFIDDYITVSEPIIDYLTEFSGISPGDLDSTTSKHALVSLKVAYKKLWLLLNLGCVFVGHGLLKDFRTINIHIPRAQVVDTVDLFFIKSRQRKLNLRFLAWYLLKEDIQTEMHDSVEDARTALRLWRKYQEFDDAGILEQMLEEVYKRGREVGFRAPGAGPKDDTSLRKENSGGRDTPDLISGSRPTTPMKKAAALAFGGKGGFGGSPMGRTS
ncbi:MAG: poly(A)-specific ribonuclease [Bogoriella megaspora]|nr:MAG: poly(A)-specific ribonuclease [Bogoriella megaspora]